jgi:cellulose biosynthesis protein BcsQ
MTIWTEVDIPYVAPPSLPVLAVGNLKGGVGKTAVVTYLALALVKRGFRVLAIDLDFQASLSTAFNKYKFGDDFDGTRQFLLSNGTDILFNVQVVKPCLPPWNNLTALRSNFDLADTEDRLFAQMVLGDYEHDPRLLLASKLADPTLQHDFDIVILDTPPRLTVASINALCACTHLLIPTAPTAVALGGADTFIRVLEASKPSICSRLSILGILPTLLPNVLAIFGPRTVNGVEVWNDVKIFQKADIAKNADFNCSSIATLFNPLADKIQRLMGLKSDGGNHDTRPPVSARLNR